MHIGCMEQEASTVHAEHAKFGGKEVEEDRMTTAHKNEQRLGRHGTLRGGGWGWGGFLKKNAQKVQGGEKSMKRPWRRSPCSHLPGMMPVVDVNAQLLQALHVGLRFAVTRQGLVAAPLCSLQRDWQLEAAEVDKVLRAAVSPPPTQSMHSSSCQHSIQSQRLCCPGCRCSVLLSITEQWMVEWLGKCCMLTAVYIHR